MYRVHIDKKTNQLNLTFKDRVDVHQAEEMYTELQKVVPLLTKGFTVLSDLSSLDHMDIQVRVSINKAMDLFSKNGISRTIRIIPNAQKDIGFNIMSLFHYSKNVIMHTFKSQKEVADYLARNS